jgi:hypothetical protein
VLVSTFLAAAIEVIVVAFGTTAHTVGSAIGGSGATTVA